jgi:hypothetical protein
VTVKQSRVLPVKLASAITQAAEALPDLRSVGLHFTGGPPRHPIARVVRPTPTPQVNLKNDNSLSFTVRYSCPRSHLAALYHLHINAAAGARVVASAPMRVGCGAVPVVKQTAVPPIAALVPVAAAAAPPAPGQPVPNANPNPNPALNANVGFASQEEEQRQLAFAGADSLGEEDTTVEYQMSRLNGSNSTGGSDDPWIVGGAAVLLTGAAGYAARTRFAAAWHRS